MVSQNKLEKYYKIIWNNQLPKEEEDFLFDLLNNKKSSNFKIDFESDYSLFLAYNASKNNYVYLCYMDGILRHEERIVSIIFLQ